MHNSVLIGKQIYLRPYELTDVEMVVEWSAIEDETFMYRGREPVSPLAIRDKFARLYQRQPPETFLFAACLIKDDILIGEVGTTGINWVNRTGETSIYLAPSWRNQGHGTEAINLLLEYCFDVLQLHVLHATVLETNTRSASAHVKQGYHPAGRMHWNDVKEGVYRDFLMFDVLRGDWLSARDR